MHSLHVGQLCEKLDCHQGYQYKICQSTIRSIFSMRKLEAVLSYIRRALPRGRYVNFCSTQTPISFGLYVNGPGFPQVALHCPLNFTWSYTWWGSEQWTEFLLIKLYHFPALAPWICSSIPSFRVLGDPKYFSYTFINRWSFSDPQRNSNHFTGFTLFSPFPTVWGHIIVVPPPAPAISYVEF